MHENGYKCAAAKLYDSVHCTCTSAYVHVRVVSLSYCQNTASSLLSDDFCRFVSCTLVHRKSAPETTLMCSPQPCPVCKTVTSVCPKCPDIAAETAHGSYEHLYDLARAIFGYESPLPKPLATLPRALKAKFQRTELFDFRIEKQTSLWNTFVNGKYVQPQHMSMLRPGEERTHTFKLDLRVVPLLLWFEIGPIITITADWFQLACAPWGVRSDNA